MTTTAPIFWLTLNPCTAREKAKAKLVIRWPGETRSGVNKGLMKSTKMFTIFSSISRLPPGTKLSLSIGAARLR